MCIADTAFRRSVVCKLTALVMCNFVRMCRHYITDCMNVVL